MVNFLITRELGVTFVWQKKLSFYIGEDVACVKFNKCAGKWECSWKARSSGRDDYERVVDTKRGRDGSGAVRAFVMLILPENDSVQCTYVCIYVIKFSAKTQ